MILDEIVAYKKEFVAASKTAVPLPELKSRMGAMASSPSFSAAVKRHPNQDIKAIAEIKKASPSKGVIREDFNPIAIAGDYAEHGAAAISVLTDELFFQGHLDYLRQVRARLDHIPLLRKDFVIDEYQIFEARAAGASAILLITGILDSHQLVDYRELAAELGMDALTEVHLECEADLAAEKGARLIGVNNRDLRTFNVDLEQTAKIIRLLGVQRDEFTLVTESGIATPAHADYMRGLGVDALLIGESLMREKSPGQALSRLFSSS